MCLPKEVWVKWGYIGVTDQEVEQLNKQGFITPQTPEETQREIEAALKELEQEDRSKPSTTNLHPLVH